MCHVIGYFHFIIINWYADVSAKVTHRIMHHVIPVSSMTLLKNHKPGYHCQDIFTHATFPQGSEDGSCTSFTFKRAFKLQFLTALIHVFVSMRVGGCNARHGSRNCGHCPWGSVLYWLVISYICKHREQSADVRPSIRVSIVKLKKAFANPKFTSSGQLLLYEILLRCSVLRGFDTLFAVKLILSLMKNVYLLILSTLNIFVVYVYFNIVSGNCFFIL